jgi:phosphoglycolate phosphatase-like HAD superfamily hydrolase
LNRLKKVIIYDCDGVLFDSKAANQAFYNHILGHFHMPEMTEEQLDYAHVSTAEESVALLFKDSPFAAEAQEYRKTMDMQPFVPLMQMEPHVREVLSRLRPTYRTAIATNRGYSMPFVLRDHRLEELIDLTVTSLDVKEPKPHPECLLTILERFEAEPDEAIYIGDAEVDRLVAERTSVPFASYKNPNLKAEYLFQDHLDLFEVLNTSGE